MSTAVPSMPPITANPRRRRWWRVALLIAVLLIGVPTAYWWYVVESARIAWEDAEAEAALDLPRWRFHEIEADLPPISDSDNSALHMLAIHRKTGLGSGRVLLVAGATNYEKIFENLPPTAQLNAQQIELIRTRLAMYTKTPSEIRKLKDMPRGRFPVTYNDDVLSTPLPHHEETWSIFDWLEHDAFLLAQNEDVDGAVESCQAILVASRVFETDMTMVGHHYRWLSQQRSIKTLERVLAQGRPLDQSLRAIQETLAREIDNSSWLRAMRGERASWHKLFVGMRDGHVRAGWLGVNFTAYSVNERAEMWLGDQFPSRVYRHYPALLRLMNRFVESAKLPTHECAARMREAAEECRQSRNPLVARVGEAFAQIHAHECRSQAYLRAGLVALACERYRLNHKNWPATLDTLVQEKLLDAIPVDPLDGQPIRYARTKDGIVVYSIGIDLTDNGGVIDRKRASEAGVDIGFRLWDVNRRRQPAMPPVVIAE